jgi:hypothetical protein
MFRLEDRLGFVMRLGFKVNSNLWKHELYLDELRLRELGLDYLYPAATKLLASKETARICVKFWTGVDIP